MPIGTRKNAIYKLALPLIGRKPAWKANNELELLLRQNYVVGGCVQPITCGRMGSAYCAGYSMLPNKAVTPDTIFRTASIAKLATALLTIRLCGQGVLSLDEDVSDLLGYTLRNPAHPDKPIMLKHLLSHSSGMLDTQAYNAVAANPVPLKQLLRDPDLFLPHAPGMRFRYSNLAAGMIGSLLEARTGKSFEALAQEELFTPLGVKATFDVSKADSARLTNIYRVLPKSAAPNFNALSRQKTAPDLYAPNPQTHYLLAAGSLYITVPELAKLLVPLMDLGCGYLRPDEVEAMKTPVVAYPDESIRLWHGLGVLIINDPKVSKSRVIGHQGFAYGCVNGLFYNETTLDGFASMNSGSSELRNGHMGCINMALIRRFAASEG